MMAFEKKNWINSLHFYFVGNNCRKEGKAKTKSKQRKKVERTTKQKKTKMKNANHAIHKFKLPYVSVDLFSFAVIWTRKILIWERNSFFDRRSQTPNNWQSFLDICFWEAVLSLVFNLDHGKSHLTNS